MAVLSERQSLFPDTLSVFGVDAMDISALILREHKLPIGCELVVNSVLGSVKPFDLAVVPVDAINTALFGHTVVKGADDNVTVKLGRC